MYHNYGWSIFTGLFSHLIPIMTVPGEIGQQRYLADDFFLIRKPGQQRYFWRNLENGQLR